MYPPEQAQSGPIQASNMSLLLKYSKALTLSVPIPDEGEKLSPNCYLHFSLQCLKWFYEDLKGIHKTFCGTTKKCENKNLS